MGTNKIVTVERTDDLSKTVDDTVETVTFAVRGVNYRIDLGKVNRDNFDAAFAPYIAAAVTGRKSTTVSDVDAVRKWGRDNGYDVKDRGALPKSVREAYDAAQTATEDVPAAKPAAAKPAAKAKAA